MLNFAVNSIEPLLGSRLHLMAAVYRPRFRQMTGEMQRRNGSARRGRRVRLHSGIAFMLHRPCRYLRSLHGIEPSEQQTRHDLHLTGL
jgi:hypothetical protein